MQAIAHPVAGRRAFGYTVAELAARGPQDIPPELVSNTHLIYSSPAALAFNSPGAEGFGVKRAGLAVPGSVMLVVSPGCCGRNTSSISELPGYENRFFYLEMSETDLITARHLKRIPKAVKAVCDSLPTRPSVVMVCITCVDALLGTDMERVCRAAEKLAGVRVRPCYMYALTREGRKPPMVNVRQSLYSLLEPAERDRRACNLLGYFAPVDAGSELRELLGQAGVRHVREISTAADYEDFQRMAQANFNLVLNPEAGPAAQDLQERLGMPWIELHRFYEVDRIHRQYEALASVLGTSFEQEAFREEAAAAMRAFRAAHAGEVFAVGEGSNSNPLELALALVRYGFRVAEVFCTVSADHFVYLRKLAELSPQTMVYSNLEPSMIDYSPAGTGVTLTIGRDAGYYHPECPNLAWNSDVQPFGYRAVRDLFLALGDVAAGASAGGRAGVEGAVSLRSERARGTESLSHLSGPRPVPAPHSSCALRPAEEVRGLRRVLTPFAPDQSGAVSVLYGMGGISVVIDAGGCVGNICGFDEPRWFANRDAVFSAGLRDMDAIMGRDDLLVRKLSDAARKVDASFAALIGTPVPSVIGTDLHALRRLAERGCGLPVISVDTDGMRLYGSGAEKAYLALVTSFAEKDTTPEQGRIGVLGSTPMDVSDPSAGGLLAARLGERGWRHVTCFGMGATLEDVRTAGAAERNLVVAPSGLAAAKWLQKRFGTPYDIGFPLAERLVPQNEWMGRCVLVVHQQVAADAIRRELLGRGAAHVVAASFFCQPEEVTRQEDVRLRSEGDFVRAVSDVAPDVILADAVLRKLVPDFRGTWYDETHFALSGHLVRF